MARRFSKSAPLGVKKMAERARCELPTPLRPFYAQKPRLKIMVGILFVITNTQKSQKKPPAGSLAATGDQTGKRSLAGMDRGRSGQKTKKWTAEETRALSS